MRNLFYFVLAVIMIKVFFPVAAIGIGNLFERAIAILNEILNRVQL